MCRGCPNCLASSTELRRLQLGDVDAQCLRCSCPTSGRLYWGPTKATKAGKKSRIMPNKGFPATFGKADDPTAQEKVADLPL